MKLRIKYPKLLLLILTFVIAYLFLTSQAFEPLKKIMLSLGYIGAFLGGIFFVYGFTAAPATAALLILAKQQSIFFSGIIAGVGALFGDLIIFKLLRSTFSDEIECLKREKTMMLLYRKTPDFLKKYLLPVFGGIIIASPLPDEIGVTLLAISKISTRTFIELSYLLNTAGIFIILLIGQAI